MGTLLKVIVHTMSVWNKQNILLEAYNIRPLLAVLSGIGLYANEELQVNLTELKVKKTAFRTILMPPALLLTEWTFGSVFFSLCLSANFMLP